MIFPVALTHSARRHLLLLPFLCLEGDGVPQSPPSTLKRLGRAAGTKPRPPSRRGWEAVGEATQAVLSGTGGNRLVSLGRNVATGLSIFAF